MFILSLTYIAPLDAVDALMDDHVAWLKQGRAAGSFLAWGRRKPRTGGIIIAVGGHDEIAAVAQTDPFVTGGVATVEVIEMTPSFVAPGLEALAR